MEDLNINIGSLTTKGYDINIGYSGVEMGRFGSLCFNLTGTYLDRADHAAGTGRRPDRMPGQVLRRV